QAISGATIDVDAVADIVAGRLEHAPEKPDVIQRVGDALRLALPQWTPAANRKVLLTNSDGKVIASAPPDPSMLGLSLLDVLGPSQPLTTFGATAGVLEITTADGALALATVRVLKAPYGQLAVIQSRADALASWRSDMTLTVTLSATTGFVVLILGFAFHWQATRAREADVIYDAVRTRIDTALNRGRCGLWDWDLARGRIFWSHSMFAIL